jgi:hypothetical protein
MAVRLNSSASAVLIIQPFTGDTVSATYTIMAGDTTGALNVTQLSLAGGATLRDVAGSDVDLSLPAINLAVAGNLIINPLPPTTVSLVTVNGGSSQRSRLTSLTLNFAMPVNAASLTSIGAISLTRYAGGTVGTIVRTGATGANGRITVSPSTGLVSSVTLTFDNADGSPASAGVENGSLADGRWQLAIPYLNYTSPLNDPNLRRLFGDSNNDGIVDGTDFAAFGAAFGQTVANSPFDFNNDGTIDGTDFAAFGNRFGATL